MRLPGPVVIDEVAALLDALGVPQDVQPWEGPLARCTFCGRATWLGTEHPCCTIERGWGRNDCEACRLAESARRRWNRHLAEVAAELAQSA